MKEKRIGYVDVLNGEFREKIEGTLVVGDSGVELPINKSKKAALKALEEAETSICVGQKGAVYEVILRQVK